MTQPDRPSRIAIVTVSDRASRGEYPDKGGPGAEDWLRATVTSPMQISRQIIPDGREIVAETLRQRPDVRTAEHRISAANVPRATSILLGIEAQAACLVLERQTWRGDDRITHVRLTFPGEAYDLVARFAPQPAANPAARR